MKLSEVSQGTAKLKLSQVMAPKAATPQSALSTQNVRRTEDLILSRSLPFAGFKKIGAEFKSTPMEAVKKYLQPFGFIRAIPAAIEAARYSESIPATAGLAAQRGELFTPQGGKEIVSALKGERPAELGDIGRQAGLPEPVSATLGTLASAGMYGAGGKFSGLRGKSLSKIGANAGAELQDIGQGIKGVAEKTGQGLKGVGNKLFRGGITPQEATRIQTEYGGSNATLVDKIKSLFTAKENIADNAYRQALNSAPAGKQINIRPAIEEAGKKLKNLGLITEKGSLTQLGQSEISRDSVYGKLLDFYQSANAISGVENLQGRGLTQGQMIKSMLAQRETLVNKDQFTFFRDKLNSLYKNKPSDVSVRDVMDKFYQSGEDSGIKGLQEARKLQRDLFNKREMFINSKTGDLKIANEAKLSKIGTEKALSKQELDHIKELERYINHPIVKDAESINKLNKAKEMIKAVKRRSRDVALGAVGLEGVRKITTGKF